MSTYSSVHHSTGGLLVLLQQPAGVVLWQFPSRHVVFISRCSSAKLPLLQDYMVVHYTVKPVLSGHPRGML